MNNYDNYKNVTIANCGDFGEQLCYLSELLRDIHGQNEDWTHNNNYRHFLVMDILKSVYKAGRNDALHEKMMEEIDRNFFGINRDEA